VIFATAFDQFAVAAFDVSAVDYLLKPVSQDRLERAVGRVRAQIAAMPAPAVGDAAPAASTYTQEFWVPHRAEIVRIPTRDIDLVEAERDYMRLHVGPRSYLLHQTITALERRLDPAMFIRLHRSTIAQRDRIAGFKHDGMGAWTAQTARRPRDQDRPNLSGRGAGAGGALNKQKGGQPLSHPPSNCSDAAGSQRPSIAMAPPFTA
jgi:two-component system response regulator AlgR